MSRLRTWIAVDGEQITGSAIVPGAHPTYTVEVVDRDEAKLLRAGLRRCLYRDGHVVAKPVVTLRADRGEFLADGNAIVNVYADGAPEGRAVTVSVTSGSVGGRELIEPGGSLEISATRAGPVIVALVSPDLWADPLRLQAIEPTP